MEIDDIHLRHCMLYEFNQKSKAAQAVRNICGVYGKEMLKERTCQRWFSKFRAGDFNLERKPPRSGNTGKVDLDELQKIIGDDNRLSTQKIAEKMNLSRSTIDRNLRKIGYAYVENEWICKGEMDVLDNDADPTEYKPLQKKNRTSSALSWSAPSSCLSNSNERFDMSGSIDNFEAAVQCSVSQRGELKPEDRAQNFGDQVAWFMRGLSDVKFYAAATYINKYFYEQSLQNKE